MKRFLFLAMFLGLMGWIVAQATVAAEVSAEGVACEAGFAGIYPCKNVDLLGHLTLAEMGAAEGVVGNDHWGWTDAASGRMFVLFGLADGTAFVEVSEPTRPVWLGTLPSHEGTSVWRDIKVYQDVAFITADVPTNHGLQLFDLTHLLTVENPPETFVEAGHYDEFGPGHNLWVNAESGYLYVFRSDTCNGEIHMVNVADPFAPQFAGCFAADDAPLSDAECVIYRGPDVDYLGRELCFTGSDDNVTISDVTDKTAPRIVANFDYPGIARAHQGALTADQQTWLLSDTMDEALNGHNTRTILIDVADIDAPRVLDIYEHTTTARDHNIYIVGSTAFETNFQAGLRLLDVRGVGVSAVGEVGYFDIVPGSDSIAISGAWSSYPFWENGMVTVSGTQEGLFVLRPRLPVQILPFIATP